jgi:transcriptional regulator with XRE-family HTH domain
VKNINKIPINQKVSLERLVKLSGVTKGYVAKLLNSNKASPFSTLIKIADALNMDVSPLSNQLENGNRGRIMKRLLACYFMPGLKSFIAFERISFKERRKNGKGRCGGYWSWGFGFGGGLDGRGGRRQGNRI